MKKNNMLNISTPNGSMTEEDMRDLLEQLPASMILLRNFNVHNPLWGSEKMSTRERMSSTDTTSCSSIKKRRNLLQSI